MKEKYRSSLIFHYHSALSMAKSWIYGTFSPSICSIKTNYS